MLHNNVFLGGMTVRKEGILGATVKNIGKHNKPFETSQRHGTSSVPARITLTAPCPAALRSPYFAYVEEFGGHRILSIYDLHADVECCAHIVEAPTILTCIDWGARRVENKVAESSKRKRVPVGSSQAILAYGTSTSKILLISATDATVLGTLEHKHTNGITNLKFAAADNYPQLWSLGNDLHLVQWDTKSCQSIRCFASPDAQIRSICPLSGDRLGIASRDISILDLKSQAPSQKLSVSTDTIEFLVPIYEKASGSNVLLATAPSDRFVGVLSESPLLRLGSLQLQSPAVKFAFVSDAIDDTIKTQNLSGNSSAQSSTAFAVVTADGEVELFVGPFSSIGIVDRSDTDGLRGRMKRRTRLPSCTITLCQGANNSARVPLIDVTFQEDQICCFSTHGTSGLSIYRAQWRDLETGACTLPAHLQFETPIQPSMDRARMSQDSRDYRQCVNEAHLVVRSGSEAPKIFARTEVSN